MRITIETIPHNSQRYNTCGDWQFDSDGNLTIKVSEMPKTGINGAMAVAVHELVESLLCRHRGITTEMVDTFDLNWDAKGEDIEPGDSPDCPCRKEHNTATGIERILITEFGIDWYPYESELIDLTENYPEHN